MEYRAMRVKINKTFGGYEVGQVVPIKTKGGIPAELYWRNRLKDSKTDNCITVIDEKKSKSSKGSNKE